MEKVYRAKAIGAKDGMVISIEQNVLANSHDHAISKYIKQSGLDEVWSIAAKLNVKETIEAYAKYFWKKLWTRIESTKETASN